MQDTIKKTSSLIGKKVFAINDAIVCGSICQIGFDSKLQRAKCLELQCQNPDDVDKKFVKFLDILCSDYDALTVRQASKVLPFWSVDFGEAYFPINMPVYNQQGQYIGILEDITLKKNTVSSIIINNKEYDCKMVFSASNQAICINDSGKKLINASKKIKKPKTIQLPKVHIAEQQPTDFLTSTQPPPLSIDALLIDTSFTDNTLDRSSTATNPINTDTSKQEKKIIYPISDFLRPRQSVAIKKPQNIIEPTPSISNNNQDNNSYTFKLNNIERPNHNTTPFTYDANTSDKKNHLALTQELKASWHMTQEVNSANQMSSSPLMPTTIDSLHTEVTKTPQDNLSNEKYNFVYGKTLTVDIRAQDGTTLFKQGTIVDEKTVSIAKVNNRLAQVVLHSE